MRLTLTHAEAKGELISVPCLSRTFEARTIATFKVRPTATPGAGPLESV